MSELRAKVEALPHPFTVSGAKAVYLNDVLDLIPEGAVLVEPGDTVIPAADAEGGWWATEETLAAAMNAVIVNDGLYPSDAADIIAKLREINGNS